MKGFTSHPGFWLLSLLFAAGSPLAGQILRDFTLVHESVGAQDPTGVVWWQDSWYAVSPGGVIYRSTDGVAWNAVMMQVRTADGSRQRNFAAGPRHLAASDAVMIAVGDAGRIFRTIDGVVWEAIPSPVGAIDFNAVAFAAGQWAIVGDAGTLLASDFEGLEWAARSPNSERNWDDVNFRAVAYGAGAWWLADGNTVYRGELGLSFFTPEEMPGNVRWRALYAEPVNDRIIAAGDQTVALRRETDARWDTSQLIGSDGFITTITASDEWILVGDSGNRFWTTRFITQAFQPFVFHTSGSFRDATASAFNGTQALVLTERSGPGSSDFIWTSEDFETFHPPMLGLNTRFFAAIDRDGMWHVGGDGRYLAHSPDGIFWSTWSEIVLPEPYTGIAVTGLDYIPTEGSDGYWLARATVQEPFIFDRLVRSAIFRSTDGVAWQLVFADAADQRSPGFAQIGDLVEVGNGGSTLLATSSDANSSLFGEGRIIRSADFGQTWEVVADLPLGIAADLREADGEFVAYSGNRRYTSRIGLGWSDEFIHSSLLNFQVLDAEPMQGEVLLLLSDSFFNERFIVRWNEVDTPGPIVPVGNFLEGGEQLRRIGETVLLKFSDGWREVQPDLSLVDLGFTFPDEGLTVGFNAIAVRETGAALIVGDGAIATATVSGSDTPTDPILIDFPTATGPADGWYQLPAFGWFFPGDSYPWVQHAEFGSIFFSPTRAETYSYFRAEGGWFLVVPALYPYLYSYAADSWVYYLAGTEGNWYYDVNRGAWVEAPDL